MILVFPVPGAPEITMRLVIKTNLEKSTTCALCF